MPEALQTALILLFALQAKHVIGDFFLQTPRMLVDRNRYLHLGRTQHAGIHAVLSGASFLILGAPLVFTVIICLIELVLHYHIDFFKGRISDAAGHTPADAGYWRAFGLDQLAHQLTYVGMIWAWAVYTI